MARKKEPTTLEVQEERYRNRILLQELRGGKSPEELRRIANAPRPDRRHWHEKHNRLI